MPDFSDPSKRIQGELEDLREDIGKREKEVRRVRIDIRDLEKRKELLEEELDELFAEEKRLAREATRMRLEG
ncbi:hypothetical protein KJ903_00855 [Patescibacteria group bacterium]|nr:hypothetical protein [Patescibacteria group bacterium]